MSLTGSELLSGVSGQQVTVAKVEKVWMYKNGSKWKYKSINVPQYFANCGEWLVSQTFNDNKTPFLSSQLTQELLIPNWGYRQERIDLFCFSCNFYQVKSRILWAVKKAKQKTHFVLWRGTTTTHLRWRFSCAWFNTPIEFRGIF